MRRWYVLSVALAAIVGVAAGVLLHGRLTGGSANAQIALPSLHGEATWKRGERPAPAFALRDQRGQSVSLASLKGRTVVVMFLDSLCKQACPVEGHLMAAALRAVPAKLRPQLVVFSVDPAGDTPRTIAAALRKWTLPASTRWLTGSQAQLARVWKDYMISVDPVSGDVVHSTAAYLIDQRGDERAGFLMPFVPGLVTDDLRKLATGAA